MIVKIEVLEAVEEGAMIELAVDLTIAYIGIGIPVWFAKAPFTVGMLETTATDGMIQEVGAVAVVAEQTETGDEEPMMYFV